MVSSNAGGRIERRADTATLIQDWVGWIRDGKPIHLIPYILRKGMATWLYARRVSDRLLQPRLGSGARSPVDKPKPARKALPKNGNEKK